jgi:rubrerythrin
MTPVNPKILTSLNFGITSEVKSYVFYMEARNCVSDPKLKELLELLAGEEKEHYQILERQHHSLVTSEHWISYNDILKSNGLPDINEDMTDTHKEMIEEIRNAPDEKKILEMAYELEEEAHHLFAEAAKNATDPEEKKTFEFLAHFEEGHMKKIRQFMDEML